MNKKKQLAKDIMSVYQQINICRERNPEQIGMLINKLQNLQTSYQTVSHMSNYSEQQVEKLESKLNPPTQKFNLIQMLMMMFKNLQNPFMRFS